VRWFLARGRLVVDADGRRRVVGTDTDVTARRAAEEALQEVQARHRAILRAIPDLMFLQDRQGVYLDAHAREAGSFLVPPEWFLGKNMRDVLPPELARSFAAAFETAMRSGESTLEYELPVRGETLHWEARMVRCDRDKVLSIVRDITARKRAEQEARGLRDELAHVGRVSLLSTLTGSIAHEINQPLAAIMANASAALRLTAAHEPDLPELRETLGDIVDDGRRAGQVLRRLRALLTKEASEHGLVELKGTLDEVLRLVDSDVVGRRVSLEVDVPADLPAVRGDRVQLQQVVLNLLLNAFEAVRDLDVPARRVRLSASATDDGRAVLSVSDEGVGVPDDELPRIFEPFYTTKRGGMGLGLPICQTIATAHGGVLQATRNRGPGMTFSLLLPAVAGEAPHAEASVALPS
jgi:PAS domain S-box-containing protein